MANLLVIIFVVLEVISLNLAQIQKRPLRIKFGKPDTVNKFPFVVKIMYFSDVPPCSGSLIAERWVLTAHHCLSPDVKEVILEYRTEPKNSTHRPVIKHFPHPNSRKRRPRLWIDIGLVLIEEIKGWPLGLLSPLNLNSLVGLPANYAGFGKLYSTFNVKGEDDAQAWMLDSQKPMHVGEGVITRCYPWMTEISCPLMCVAPKCSNRFASAGAGDSGGPLLVQNKIVGVLSIVDARNSPVKGYAPIGPFLDWINLMIKQLVTNKFIFVKWLND